MLYHQNYGKVIIRHFPYYYGIFKGNVGNTLLDTQYHKSTTVLLVLLFLLVFVQYRNNSDLEDAVGCCDQNTVVVVAVEAVVFV